MPGQRDVPARSADEVCERRRRAVELAGKTNYPLFVYSYSSRGFPDLVERLAATHHLPPAYLISLYDAHHYLADQPAPESGESSPTVRFLDSGNYEVRGQVDIWDAAAPPGTKPWSEDLYVATAKSHARPGDVLVSFDDFTMSVPDQITRAKTLFDKVGITGIRRDLLVHPNGCPPADLARMIASQVSDVEIVGLTEKEIGRPWFRAVDYLQRFRRTLDDALGRYVPIHVFGCLDPRTLPYLFFSGADIFDGLAWMRYHFLSGHAFYAKEFEYEAPPQEFADPIQAELYLLRHNIEELERLRADLRYAVLSGDHAQFTKALEGVALLEGNANAGEGT